LQRRLTANVPATSTQGNAKVTGVGNVRGKAIRAAGIGKARQLVGERGYWDHGPGYAIAEFPKGN
jgi:hypothetical protein